MEEFKEWEGFDETFEDDETQDEVVTDVMTGFLEKKSECIRQEGGWTHRKHEDADPYTQAYRQMYKEENALEDN